MHLFLLEIKSQSYGTVIYVCSNYAYNVIQIIKCYKLKVLSNESIIYFLNFPVVTHTFSFVSLSTSSIHSNQLRVKISYTMISLAEK